MRHTFRNQKAVDFVSEIIKESGVTRAFISKKISISIKKKDSASSLSTMLNGNGYPDFDKLVLVLLICKREDCLKELESIYRNKDNIKHFVED